VKLDLSQSLRGIRVIDASRVLAGPFAAQTLADLGAEVLKIEQPGAGDDTRGWGPPFVGSPEMSAYFLAANRGKRSLALDLKRPEGATILQRLLSKSDILIENFRSDSVSRLGLDPEKLLKSHPHLIVCSISGFGRSGPYAYRAGYDFVMQGLSGLMAKTGPVDGPPSKVGVAITDIVTGLYASTAILASLHQKERSGHGYHIDVALLDCAVASMANVAQAFLATGTEPKRQGNAHLQIVPYEAFATKDGWMILAVGNDGQWRRFADVAGESLLGTNPLYATNTQRLTYREQLVPIVAHIIKKRTTHEWMELLERAQVPAGPVWNMTDLFSSDLAKERGIRVTLKDPDGRSVDFIKSPLHSDGQTTAFPPRLGEHSAEILREVLGIEDHEILYLKENGIVS
jgi:crotonobetainyl-CoA:carnitine CoA-transferase CaiB-like acyl-CoA transferase